MREKYPNSKYLLKGIDMFFFFPKQEANITNGLQRPFSECLIR